MSIAEPLVAPAPRSWAREGERSELALEGGRTQPSICGCSRPKRTAAQVHLGHHSTWHLCARMAVLFEQLPNRAQCNDLPLVELLERALERRESVLVEVAT